MNIFRTAESFQIVKYTQDGSNKTANIVLNIPTIFFDFKIGFTPMPIFEYLRHLFGKDADVFNQYAQLKHRETDNQLSVVLNHLDVHKAKSFVAYINDLYISAQKCNLYIQSQLNNESLLEFETWLRVSGEYKKLQLQYQLETFSTHGSLNEVNQNENEKPVLLSRLIMKFKQQSISSNEIVHLI